MKTNLSAYEVDLKKWNKEMRSYSKQIETLAKMEKDVGYFPKQERPKIDESQYFYPKEGEFDLTEAQRNLPRPQRPKDPRLGDQKSVY